MYRLVDIIRRFTYSFTDQRSFKAASDPSVFQPTWLIIRDKDKRICYYKLRVDIRRNNNIFDFVSCSKTLPPYVLLTRLISERTLTRTLINHHLLGAPGYLNKR